MVQTVEYSSIHSIASVKIDRIISNLFEHSAAVRQRYIIISPIFLNLYTEYKMELALENCRKYADTTFLLLILTSQTDIEELLRWIETFRESMAPVA